MKNVITVLSFAFVSVFFSTVFATNSHAVTMAIVDSGTDLRHIDLMSKAWINADEVNNNNADDDNNGKVDDYNGWNFAENDNKIIDYSYLGTFSNDPYRFFEIQFKMFNGTANAEEKQWIRQKREDQDFLAELQKFGNFVHGTHVAGITAQNAKDAKIMGVKLIPTEVKKPFADALAPAMAVALDDGEDPADNPLIDLLVRQGLSALAQQQGKMLEPIGLYLWFEKAKVANCSFGTSTHAIAPLIAQILEALYKRKPTEEETMKYASFFIGEIVANGKQFAIDAKDTFFVIAAGNDGTNNDDMPTYPANIKRLNTLTVAASFGYAKLASFSNYGSEMVDVAAPGVGIRSSIPGNEYLVVSGTSQASPFVANVAGRILDTNPNLTFAQLKRILMDTTDKKDFLVGKVRSEGIVNAERAVTAAMYTLTKSLDHAIARAILEIPDVKVSKFEALDAQEQDDAAMLLPMPQLFR